MPPPKTRSSAAAARAPKPRPRERLDVDERRAQLVRLGIDLFADRPYDEVSIDELARMAGISKGLLYHYFPTKRDFYLATVREAARAFLERTETPADMPPLDRMRAGLDAYLDYVEGHAAAYAALMRGGVGADVEVARIVDETRARVGERLLEGLTEVKPTAVLRIALRGWIGMCEAMSLAWIEKRRAAPRDTVRDVMIEVLLALVPIATAKG
jgi:AcrR family transcriptional regulator